MNTMNYLFVGCLLLLAAVLETVQSTCVLESDFGFKINCAFKKSGLFRVRNLGGIKAHASLGFSLGDELGFEQSLTNMDPSRRRSVNIKNGAPQLITDTTKTNGKQEKRGKQNRIMMRPPAPINRPNQSAMDKLTSLHRRVSTMQPIVVHGPTIEAPTTAPRVTQSVTIAKPMPMGVPPFRPLPPKEDTLKVLPLTTRKAFTPLQIPQSKGPGPAYNNPVPQQVHHLASHYPVNTKKIDDYNSISGYGDDTALKFNKEDINAKIAEIAKVGNISMEAVEAAIALRQQQLLNKYANIPLPTTTTTSTTTTTTTELPVVFQSEPEPEVVLPPLPQAPKRNPTAGKVMNAPREYYPVGYEKNFDDQFQSKVDLPDTVFHCGDQKYFPGLYGDESLGCMVFHVCALTDDGLVMKSFLCPESTLFDQTILKCNWWFYVDCKNTRRLYDTNIPVSKSYQLMKALTFFSSYKKEMQEDGKTQTNPEEVAGIKEAITILENQDSKPVQSNKDTVSLQIVTPQPILDERHNHRVETTSQSAPVYRGNRNFKNLTSTNATVSKLTQTNNEFKLITLTTGLNFKDNEKNTTGNVKSGEISAEKRHRRRMTLRNNNSSTTTKKPSTITTKSVEMTAPLVEIIKQEIQPIDSLNIKPETLTDQIDDGKIEPNLSESILAPVKRFYRSSLEKESDEQKEMAIVNNEKVQIVRPTSSASLVDEFQTHKATIAKLDEAVLGKQNNPRIKKSSMTIVLPQKQKDYRGSLEQT